MADRLHSEPALVQFSERLTEFRGIRNPVREGMDLVGDRRLSRW